MSLARILSRTQLGLDVPLAQVELHDGRGLPGFTIVGLPAPVVRESRERVRAALLNSGYEFPAGRITVNLAPVELSKQGARFDLPIASGQLSAPQRAFECYGELGLAGELRPVSGLFLAALHAGEDGHALIVPVGNGAEVALSGHGAAYSAASLREAAIWPTQTSASAAVPARVSASGAAAAPPLPALADVAGQWQAKRALIIAAAGGHRLLIAFTSFSIPVSMPAGRAAPRGNQQRPYSARRATRRSAPSGNQCSRPVCPRRAIGVPLGRAPLDDGRESVWDHVAVQHRLLTLDGVPDQLLAELRLPRGRRVPISRRRHQIPPWLPGAAHSHASNHERQRQCSYCCQQFPNQSSSSAV